MEYMIGVIFAYLLFCVVLAEDNSTRIEQGKKIHHWLNGLIHIFFASLMAWVHWTYGVALLFLVRVVFDVSLNLFRGLPIDYVPAKPLSVIDRLESKIWGNNGYTPKIVYITIAICLLAV
jgi:hypothetical protein